MLRWIRGHLLAASVLCILALYVFAAGFGSAVVPYDPNAPDPLASFGPPSMAHPLGADSLGRDWLSRVISGSWVALVVAVVAVTIAFVFGLLIGVIAGYFGGFVDTVLTRSQDVLFAFPTLLLAIIIVGALGPSVMNASIAIGIVYVPRFARIARASAVSLQSAAYLDASRLSGKNDVAIIYSHVVPNVLGPLVVLAALNMANAELAYAALSFLGLGARPPQADWGSMLATAGAQLGVAPWLVLGPGIALVVFLVALNLLGDVFRDALDPRARTGSGVVTAAEGDGVAGEV